VHEHAFGEGAQVDELRDGLAVLREPGRLVGTAHGRLALAEIRTSGDAVLARAAERRQTPDHVIAGYHVADGAADGLHHAGGLVTEHDRTGFRERSLEHVRSLWQTPVAAVRTRTSRGPGVPSWISSMASGS
jgi:hypothetical protein